MAAILVVSLVGMVTALGAGVVGAVHPDDAPDLTEEADFQVEWPSAGDAYPGNQNPEGGSINYFASGADAFAVQDAEEGVFIDYIIIHSIYDGEEWIDYSACSTDNTEAFGIDRGNNNEGTQYDEDLVSRQKTNNFRDDGIVINFFNWEDFTNDPPYMAPEDAIVASQGEGSAAGPCLTLTNQPGWYRIAGYMNGTIADNGPDQQPSDSAEEVSLQLNSNYLYVCECDSEEEAREQLGPPPNENGGNGDDGNTTPEPDDGSDDGNTTPEPDDGDTTPEPDDGNTDGDTTPEPDDGNTDGDTTPEPDDGDTTPEPDDGSGDGQTDGNADDTANTDGDGNVDDGGAGGTPTPGDAPGFGPIAALIALLASTLLLYRRG